MRDLLEAKAGRMTIAVSAGAASAVIPPIVSRYLKRHPNIKIDLYDVAPDELLPFAVAGNTEFEIGSIEGEPVPDVRIDTLLQTSLSIIASKDGVFERKKSAKWDDISGLRIIAMRGGTRIRAQSDNVLSQTGRKLTPALEVSLITTALALSAEGAGASVLPAHMLPKAQFPTLAAVPLTGPRIGRHVSIGSSHRFHCLRCRKVRHNSEATLQILATMSLEGPDEPRFSGHCSTRFRIIAAPHWPPLAACARSSALATGSIEQSGFE